MVCCLPSWLTPKEPSVWRSSSGSGKKAFPARYPWGRVNGWCSIGLEQEQEKKQDLSQQNRFTRYPLYCTCCTWNVAATWLCRRTALCKAVAQRFSTMHSVYSAVIISYILIIIGYIYQQMLIQYVKYCKWLVHMPIRVAVRSKACLCCCSLAGIAVSNPAGVIDVCLLRVLCVVR